MAKGEWNNKAVGRNAIPDFKILIMARKEDVHTRENIDRGREDDQAPCGTNERNNNFNDDVGSNESETIKNANAAGLGAIGRNDQKQTGDSSNHSADAGNE